VIPFNQLYNYNSEMALFPDFFAVEDWLEYQVYEAGAWAKIWTYRSFCAGLAPRGVVVIFPGLHAHANRYGELGNTLSRAGFEVFSMDYRFAGKSTGPNRGNFDNTDEIV
jgi:alpha-beta hydrolase superfamily lysophospholipase